MKITKLTLLLLLSIVSLQAREIHVSPSGSNSNNGSAQNPYRTISKAAYVAIAGDSVIIHEGTYRERVSPANGGLSPANRIVYAAAEGEKVYLKGSDEVTGWRKVSGDVWRIVLPNTHFGEFNPYEVTLFGDWLGKGRDRHLGEVYINGYPLNEKPKVEDIKSLPRLMWHAVVDDENTTIYANFEGHAPNKSLTEINVRPTCFTPHTNGVNYITVDGLDIMHAATQWSPPTGEQVGMVNPNWSKGWIIKNCNISYSKCVGICIGKERSTGHNISALYKGASKFNKAGFTREIEAIISAINRGWSRENIGSHTIENNKIFECGQAGIVGHLGCIFSTIRNNEIYNNNLTEDFGGFETGGIKLHAAIDVVIENNVIRNSRRGIWLDWQAQGTHVRNNIFTENIVEDLFIEVSHGPTLVYNNIMLSDVGLFVDAQGVMFANNLIYGKVRVRASQTRYTPYHMPHSTQLRGLFNSAGGDVRFYNNIFYGKVKEKDGSIKDNGLSAYNNYPTNMEDAKNNPKIPNGLDFKLPVYTFGNVYYKGATPHKDEVGHTVLSTEAPTTELTKSDEGEYILSEPIDLNTLKRVVTTPVTTEILGHALIPEQLFENIDETPFVLDKDLYGRPRDTRYPTVGPIETEPEYIIRQSCSYYQEED